MISISNVGSIAAMLVATAGVCGAAAQQSQSYFDESDIPISVRSSGMAGKLRMGLQAGVVSAIGRERCVNVLWTASAIANQEPDYSLEVDFANRAIGGAKATTRNQMVGTNFFPTAFGKLSDSEVLVAGIRSSGVTVVQRWTLVWPPQMPSPTQDVESGLTSVEVVFPTIERSNVFVGPALSGRRYVTGINSLRRLAGAPTQALIQFLQPDNDVMVMDLSSGGFELLASEANSSAELGVLTSLATKDYSQIGFGDKTDTGYCYRFWRGDSDLSTVLPAGSPPTPILMLVDNDRDGTIDNAVQLTSGQFVSGGFDNLRNYAAFWLD